MTIMIVSKNLTTYIVHNDFLVDFAEQSSFVQYGGHSVAAR